MTVFFAGGYAFGSHQSETAPAVSRTYEPVREVNAKTETEESVTVYTVILDGSNLYLYSVTDGLNTEIARRKISEGVFPADDVEMLKNGVTLDNRGDAQELFENFVS